MKQMPRIKMMGIGHGGNHMLDYVMNQSIRNVEYITVADEETLLQSGGRKEHTVRCRSHEMFLHGWAFECKENKAMDYHGAG